ncbi:MAG: hypothetical protein GF329_19980 [Candidatus Lokiarchaeota archaeon]|nr:hypothetical protein [Candidatus Lokiarchaeota archaeon]
MSLANEYIEVIKEKIQEIIKDFDEGNISSFEENFETLKHIFETYTGNPNDLYPYLNNIFKFIYDSYKQDPSEYNRKFLSITGKYVGEIFEFWKDYGSAINAYSYSFFIETDLQSITKLLKIQIMQLILNNYQFAEEINGIITGLSDEIEKFDYSESFTLNDREITFPDALKIVNLFINLSNYLLELKTSNTSQFGGIDVLKDKIKDIQKKLMIEGIKLYYVNKNIDKLFVSL